MARVLCALPQAVETLGVAFYLTPTCSTLLVVLGSRACAKRAAIHMRWYFHDDRYTTSSIISSAKLLCEQPLLKTAKESPANPYTAAIILPTFFFFRQFVPPPKGVIVYKGVSKHA